MLNLNDFINIIKRTIIYSINFNKINNQYHFFDSKFVYNSQVSENLRSERFNMKYL
jgi:hypothetical protein